MLTDIVSFKVAQELAKLHLWYYDTIEDLYLTKDSFIKYGNEQVPVKRGDLLTLKEVSNIDHAMYIDAPTYAEAIDALSIAGVKINIFYNKGFMYFHGELEGTGNSDTSIVQEHREDEWLENGILNACDLLHHYDKN